ALDHLRAHGVEVTFEEDRQGGVVNGPRAYFHDPDGTVLEFIDLTGYAGKGAGRTWRKSDGNAESGRQARPSHRLRAQPEADPRRRRGRDDRRYVGPGPAARHRLAAGRLFP